MGKYKISDAFTNFIEIPKELSKKFKEGEVPNSIDVEVEFSRIGYINKNYRYYDPSSAKKAARSLVFPYPKPIIKQHKLSPGFFESGSPSDYDAIGRVISSEYREIDNSGNKNKPAGIQVAIVRISGKDNVEKVLDGRLLTVSAGGSAALDNVTCSICGKNIFDEEACGHIVGEKYKVGEENKKRLCYMNIKDYTYNEISFVNNPADTNARVTKVLNDSIKDEYNVIDKELLDKYIDSDVILKITDWDENFISKNDGKLNTSNEELSSIEPIDSNDKNYNTMEEEMPPTTELQENYKDLKSLYNDLKTNYDELKDKYSGMEEKYTTLIDEKESLRNELNELKDSSEKEINNLKEYVDSSKKIVIDRMITIRKSLNLSVPDNYKENKEKNDIKTLMAMLDDLELDFEKVNFVDKVTEKDDSVVNIEDKSSNEDKEDVDNTKESVDENLTITDAFSIANRKEEKIVEDNKSYSSFKDDQKKNKNKLNGGK